MPHPHRRRRSRTLVALSALAAVLLLAAPAGAQGPPLQGEGSGLIDLDKAAITEIRNAGGNSIQERELNGKLSGTLDGTFEETATGTVHRTGRITFRAELVFTGTVDGCGHEEPDNPDTLVLKLAGQGQSAPPPDGPITEASVRVVGDERNTIDATGQGTVYQVGTDLTYDLQYRCR